MKIEGSNVKLSALQLNKSALCVEHAKKELEAVKVFNKVLRELVTIEDAGNEDKYRLNWLKDLQSEIKLRAELLTKLSGNAQ